MSEVIFQGVGRLLDAAAEVIGVPLWIAGKEDYAPSRRKACPNGVKKPEVLSDPDLVTCGCGANVLLVPVCGRDGMELIIRSGHVPHDFTWTTSILKVRNLGDVVAEWEVPALPVTAALLSTIASSVCEIGRRAPNNLNRATNDVAGENVRRICASLAVNLYPKPAEQPPDGTARSLDRVPAIVDFINRVFHDGQSLTDYFQDLTRNLGIGFGLVDLSATSLVKQQEFLEICTEIRKRNPLQCVLSDLTHVWNAVLFKGCPELSHDFYTYQCPFHFTEVFCPVFAGDLAVGAVFGGQIVESEEQREQIRSATAVHMRSEEAAKVAALSSALDISSAELLGIIQSACKGLAGLTGSTFREWCRAETHSGLRAGLIGAASGSDVLQLVQRICPLIVRYLDVTACSIWLLEGDRLVLAASTAPQLFARSQPGTATTPTRSAELIGKAHYKLGEGLTGLAGQTRQPVRTPNATKEPGWWGKYSETPSNSQFVAVPLLQGKELLGVLRASKLSDQSQIPDEEFNLLKEYGDEISIAISEKRLKEQLKAEAEGFRLALVERGHEFRSPLHNILALVSLLNSRLPKDPELLQIGKRIEEESDRAKGQMKNSLLFGTNVPFHFRRLPLGDLFEPCALQYENRAAERNIPIVVWDSVKRLPAIMMDQDRMAQAITNILDNAVKWSFQGERIQIRGEHSDKWVKFSIQDRGTGIPPEYHELIFEQLFKRRVIDDRTRFVPGTGIGLKIVSKIVQAHRGKIEVASVPFLNDPARQSPQDGHIVTFTVTLPRTQN